MRLRNVYPSRIYSRSKNSLFHLVRNDPGPLSLSRESKDVDQSLIEFNNDHHHHQLLKNTNTRRYEKKRRKKRKESFRLETSLRNKWIRRKREDGRRSLANTQDFAYSKSKEGAQTTRANMQKRAKNRGCIEDASKAPHLASISKIQPSFPRARRQTTESGAWKKRGGRWGARQILGALSPA